KTRGFNAMTFAVMTVFSSGISMYALAKLLELILGWSFHTSVILSAAIVLAYIFLGGLTSAIYNEVLQFFLIVMGFLPLVLLGLKDVGGWSGLTAKLSVVATNAGFAPGAFSHSWKYMDAPTHNPMGVEWFGLVMGLGFAMSFGYWCTDFLVVQPGMAGNVTAFNTVWTYDIYQTFLRPGKSDSHYLRMGHAATVFGILASVVAAYAATRFNNINDILQLVFSFVNGPLFATFLLGMFWKRT